MIENLKMVPSSGGRFEVTVGDKLIYSKKAEGRHADEGEVLTRFQEKMGVDPMPRE